MPELAAKKTELAVKTISEQSIPHDNIIFVWDTQAKKITIDVCVATTYSDGTKHLERHSRVLRNDDYENALIDIFSRPSEIPEDMQDHLMDRILSHFLKITGQQEVK